MTFADADFGFHPEAQAEFVADVEWFEGREIGLGERCDGAVRSAIKDAVLSPEAWPKWQGWDREPAVRSRAVDKFPYRVVYFVADELVIVLAVAHEKRRPGYWRDRVIR